MTAPASPFWSLSRHQDRRARLYARNRIRDALRSYFAAEDFCEIDTAALQISPGNETHIGAFVTQLNLPGQAPQPFYLHTSPEFACKKLLAAGESKIMTLSHVFRNGERGPMHHPEFTMLEWYRAHSPYTMLFDDCRQLLRHAAEVTKTPEWNFRGKRANPLAAPKFWTLVEAFRHFANIDLEVLLPDPGQRPDQHLPAFTKATQALGLRLSPDDDWSDLFSKILSERIEPHLGVDTPAFLIDYPVSEAALARAKPEDQRFAERFELYVCGVELANGFGELTDPIEQGSRFEKAMDERQRLYGERFPIDEDFLCALAHMPPASGCALGFDRLAMLATGATQIEDVLWSPLPGRAD